VYRILTLTGLDWRLLISPTVHDATVLLVGESREGVVPDRKR
jgi:hypothetical protein